MMTDKDKNRVTLVPLEAADLQSPLKNEIGKDPQLSLNFSYRTERGAKIKCNLQQTIIDQLAVEGRDLVLDLVTETLVPMSKIYLSS